MSYAIRNDGAGWRAVNGSDDCAQDETWSETTPPAPGPQLSDYTDAVQAHLDAEARTHGYDSILSACTYAGSTIAKYAAEGQACIAWRDMVWVFCKSLLADIHAGIKPQPAIKDLINQLPPMVWPT